MRSCAIAGLSMAMDVTHMRTCSLELLVRVAIAVVRRENSRSSVVIALAAFVDELYWPHEGVDGPAKALSGDDTPGYLST